MRKVMAKALNAALSRAFNQWVGVAEKAAWLKKQASAMLGVGVARAFRAWLDMLDERERQMKLIRRALSGSVLRAWNRWLDQVEERNRLKTLASRTLGTGAAMAWGFHKWLEYNAQLAELAKLARRALNSGMMRAWNVWCDSLGDRHKMARFLRRAMNRGLAKAWGQWMEMLDEREMLAKFGKRMLNRAALKCFDTWLEMLDERERLKIFAKRMLEAGLVKAWNQWNDVLYQMRRLRKFAYRLANRATSRAFEQWLDALDELKRRQRFMRRWRNVGLSKAFTTWQRMCDEERDALRLRQRVLARILGDLTSTHFYAWSEYVAAEHERKGGLKRKGVNMMRNKLVSECFYSWATLVGEEERRQEKMRPFLNRVLNGLLTVAFEGWRDAINEMVGLRKRFAARIANTLLAKCYLAWASLIPSAASKDDERTRKINDAINRMRMKSVHAVFTAWRDYVAKAGEMKAMAIARWEASAVGPAFRTWVDYADDRRRFKELGTKVVARYRNQLLALTFLAWQNSVGLRAEEEARTKGRALAMLSGNLIAIYFERWSEYVDNVVQARHDKALAMYSRYLNQALTKCFLAWAADTLGAREEQKALMAKAAGFISGRKELMLRFYWEQFCVAIAAAYEDREEKVRGALARMSNGLLLMAVEQWKAFVKAGVAERKRADALAAQDRGAAQAAMFADTLLATTQSLSAAVQELRDAGSMRDEAASASVEESSRTNAATEQRLAHIEKQLATTSRMLGRTEKLLQPLPSAAVDQAAYALMRSEVMRLDAALAQTQQQMYHMNASKAGRSELSNVRNAVHRFLFGNSAPPPPPRQQPALPMPSRPSTALPAPSELPLTTPELVAQFQARSMPAAQQQMQMQRSALDSRSSAHSSLNSAAHDRYLALTGLTSTDPIAAMASTRPALQLAYGGAFAGPLAAQQPRPPTEPRPGVRQGGRTTQLQRRPATARTPVGMADGYGVVTGAPARAESPPRAQSARAPSAASPHYGEPYGGAETISAAAAAALAAGDAARFAATSAFSKAAAAERAGLVESGAAAAGGGNFESVELVELTELFEERRSGARRSSGGTRRTAGGVTTARPNTGKTGRPLTPRGQLAANSSPRANRFPVVG